jgi:segregation and condensation protein A
LSEAHDPLVVNLDQFQGPLDLLLHLIRKQDIDIFDIPIATITHEFLEAIGDLERADLERAGDFLEMAATLIRIKAQMLFPRREAEDDDDPRAELVRRLLEYEHFREAAKLLGGAERERARYHGKGYVEPRRRAQVSDAPLDTRWEDVWAAVMELAGRSGEPEPGYRVAPRQVRIEEQSEHILKALSSASRVEFASFVAPWGTRMHAAISLLACLELARQSTLRLRQASPFAALWIYRRKGEKDAA